MNTNSRVPSQQQQQQQHQRSDDHHNHEEQQQHSLTITIVPTSATSTTTSTSPTNRRYHTNKHSSSFPTRPLVRHAGRAHIRGKIRRIWRPRYLELLDNGHVRYYEVPPDVLPSSSSSSSSGVALLQQQHHQHQHSSWESVFSISPTPPTPKQQVLTPREGGGGNHHEEAEHDDNHWGDSSALLFMIPKYTLRVYQARILDPTALRDIHVGLPRGCFGFLFRGQRIVLPEEEDDDDYDHPVSYNDLDINDAQQSTTSTSKHSQSQHQFTVAPEEGSTSSRHTDDHGHKPSSSVGSSSSNSMMMMSAVLLDQPAKEASSTTLPPPPRGSHHHQRSTSSSSTPFTTPTFLMSPLAACGGGNNRESPSSATGRLGGGGVPGPGSGGVNHHHHQQQMEQQRDFLCAVSTLEEAQTWVVALQWAAMQQEKQEQQQHQQPSVTAVEVGPSTTVIPEPTPSLAAALGWEEETGLEEYYTTNLTAPATKDLGMNQHGSSNNINHNTAESTTQIQTIQHSSKENALGGGISDDDRKKTSHDSGGTIVVSKVAHVRLVSTAWCEWEIAYEIHVLLIRVSPPVSTNANVNNNKIDSNDGIMIEEWSMLRTAQDLENLVIGLCQELGSTRFTLDSPSGNSQSSIDRVSGIVGTSVGLDRSTLIGPLQQLPRWNDRHSVRDVSQWGSAMSIVDSILRSLVLDAAMVNTQAMKAFLGLAGGSNGGGNVLLGAKPFTTATITSQESPESAKTLPSSVISAAALLPSFLSSLGLGSVTTTTTSTTKDTLESDSATSHSSNGSLMSPRSFWTVMIQFLSQQVPLHHPQSVLTKTKQSLSEQTSTDQYVKQWMQHKKSTTSTSSTTNSSLPPWYSSSSGFWYLDESYFYHAWIQRPLFWLSGLGTLTLIGPTLWRQYSQSVPHVSVRLDYLLASWVGAACLGHRIIIVPTSTTSTTISHTADNASKNSLKGKANISGAQPSQQLNLQHESSNLVSDETSGVVTAAEEEDSDGEETNPSKPFEGVRLLSSPLPQYLSKDGIEQSCWSQPEARIFYVRSTTYLKDRVKLPSGPAAFTCRGVDMWMTDMPARHIARHPAVLGGRLDQEDTFLVNFLLPFGNLVAYFSIPPLHQFPNKKLRTVWTKFLRGDQQYRDARLKLLPIVLKGPWIVKAAVGPGKSPALLGKGIPLQYFFRDADPKNPTSRKAAYEVDVIITASTIAKGILSVVKNHTRSVSIAFALIIEASQQEELPESILCSFQIHGLHLEDCPVLPECDLDPSPL